MLLLSKLKQTAMFWLYLGSSIMLLILLAGLLSSCSVVKTDLSGNARKDATVYYYLPETVLKIHATAKIAVIYDATDSTLTGSPQLLGHNFLVTSEMIADTRTLLSLNYKPNALMSDEIKYGVNSKGLLETVEIKTDDRTADIIAKLAEAPQTVLGLAAAPARASGTFTKIKEFSADFMIRASSLSTAAITIPWNIDIENEFKLDDYVTATASFDISSPNAAPSPAPTVASFLTTTEISAILTRPLANIQLNFQPAGATVPGILPVDISIADVTRLITIPVNRTAFVKRENKISLVNGLITSHEIKKPSSVEGFVSIPINVAKAVVSIPGQLVTFKIDNTKRLTELEKEKLNLEKSLQDAQKFALTKESELEKVKLEIEKASLSNEFALKTLKLELEKSLLEAETKQLQALKALQEIKDEIDKLKKKADGK